MYTAVMAAAAASYELTNLGFGFRPVPTFIPSKTCFTRKNQIYRSVSCSLVNKQQQQQSVDQVSFSKDENSLIEALIGIQGRGRSASPLQLQVCVI